MKVFKIEIMVIDFDQLGEDEVKNEIENVNYPNDCLSPQVKNIESVDIEWSDEHPLNLHATSEQTYKDLFPIVSTSHK